jgi:hypothetical protein
VSALFYSFFESFFELFIFNALFPRYLQAFQALKSCKEGTENSELPNILQIERQKSSSKKYLKNLHIKKQIPSSSL